MREPAWAEENAARTEEVMHGGARVDGCDWHGSARPVVVDTPLPVDPAITPC